MSLGGNSSPITDNKDEVNDSGFKRCTTPVTVTHFSWSDRGKLEQVILPSSSFDSKDDTEGAFTVTNSVTSHSLPYFPPKVTTPTNLSSQLQNSGANVAEEPFSNSLSFVNNVGSIHPNNPFITSLSTTITNPFHSSTSNVEKPNSSSNPFQESESHLNSFLDVKVSKLQNDSTDGPSPIKKQQSSTATEYLPKTQARPSVSVL